MVPGVGAVAPESSSGLHRRGRLGGAPGGCQLPEGGSHAGGGWDQVGWQAQALFFGSGYVGHLW